MSDPAVTVLLKQWRAGDEAALEQLLPIVYDQLHQIAAAHMRKERAGHTLGATALVSEAYQRLVGDSIDWNDRVHFFAVASRHMRLILVDYARKHTADKRGGGAIAVTFDDHVAGGQQRPEQLLALDEALRGLAEFDDRKARIVEMYYFGGMSQPEIAEHLGVHVNTVARDLKLAEAWLNRFLAQ